MKCPLVNIWRRIIIGEGKAWVLFGHGTCVIFADTGDDLVERALSIMRDWGPVRAGGSAGDFCVIELDDDPGWVVACHHPDVLNYVSPDDLQSEPSDLVVGLIGRSRRHADAQECEVIHVEAPPVA